MKKSRATHEITRLNGAAFRLRAETVRGGLLELSLDETLVQAFGGSIDPGACTEFTCNVYAPPPPPLGTFWTAPSSFGDRGLLTN